MERLRKQLLTALGFAIAGMIGTAVGSGSARAVVATLVEIVNTKVNPVRTYHVAAENPATQSVTVAAGCDISAGKTSCNVTLQGSSGDYVVPAGKRLVVESTNGTIGMPHGQLPLQAILGFSNSLVSNQGLYIAGFNMHKTSGGYDNYYFDSQFRAYADPGSSLYFTLDRTPDTTGVAIMDVTVVGHLEDIQ